MDTTTLKTFPGSYIEALTMLYLERQDLTDKTPEDLAEMYWTTYDKVSAAGKAAFSERRKKWLT